MTTALVALLLLAFAAMLTPRGGQARAEIRAAAAVAGWYAVVPAVRHLFVQALLLLVEALRLIWLAATVLAQVLALLAHQLEAAGRPA